MLATRAGLAAATVAAASGADDVLGLEVCGVIGVFACRGFLGADVTVVGMDLGVEVDGPALGVLLEALLERLDPVLNIVGVKPVSRKTSEIERG